MGWVGRGVVVLWLAGPLPLGLWIVRFTSVFSVFFSLFGWDKISRVDWNRVFSFPGSFKALVNLFPLIRVFSSDIYCCNLFELLEINLRILWGPPYDWVLLEFFTLIVNHTEPSAIHEIQFRFSHPGTASSGGFCSQYSSLAISDSLYSAVHLSDLGGCSLPCALLFLTDPRRIYDF